MPEMDLSIQAVASHSHPGTFAWLIGEHASSVGDWTVTVHLDFPHVDLRAGDVLEITPQETVNCDCRYQSKSGEVIVMQHWHERKVRVTSIDGSIDYVTRAQADAMIAGRVISVKSG